MKAGSNTLKSGDAVQWNSRGTVIGGHAVEKLEKNREIGSHHVAASREHPEYLVRGAKTQEEAAHTAKALEKTTT